MNQAALRITPGDTKASHHLLVREFNHPSVFSTLSPGWDELTARCAAGSPFLTAGWNMLWWNHWHRDRRLKILALYEPDGTLCGIAPFCYGSAADETALMLLGSPDVCDYRDCIVARGAEARFYHALTDYLMRQHSPRFMLTFNSLPHHSPTFSFFSTLEQREMFEVDITLEDTAPFMDLPSELEAYLNRLPAKERHEIRRKKRRAEKEGSLAFERLSDPSRVMAAMPSFLDLFRSSGDTKRSFLTPVREAFFLALAGEFSRRGWLDLYALVVNGTPATYLLCFSYNRTLYLYNAAYDSRFAHLSPGIVAIALCIEDAIRRGIERFEFLRGNETYKYRFGGRDRHIYTLTCNHRGE
jgi:CelD/BcsL family acetyltransferase involved in cellulose biosynthesis